MQLTIFEHNKTEKRCCTCKGVRPLDSFCKNKRQKDGLHPHCSKCRKNYYKENRVSIAHNRKILYENNKEFYLTRNNAYYQNNKEVILHKAKVYYENNKEVILQKTYANQKHRLKSDPLFRLIHTLRSRVGHFYKSVSLQKNCRTMDALGCNREEFIAYFEPLFTEGMTWENYGAWHVDHIKPISLATTEQEAIQLSHYTNLQPLWAEDNLRKGNKYD